MMRVHIRLLLAIILSFISLSSFSEMKEYIREYTYAVGDADSKVSSRQISMKEVKLELLSELGTYIDSRIEMQQSNKSKDEFKHEITALTAGFVKVEMLEERFDGVTYYLKAKLQADPDEIVNKINELGENNNKAKEQKALLMQSYEESEKLRDELAQLRKQMKKYKNDYTQQSKLIEKYQSGTKKMSIEETYNTAQDYNYGLKGLPKDKEKAFKLFMSAADKGHGDAMGQVSNAYFRGDGVKKDYNQAVVWAQKGIEKGSKVSHYSMANLYHMGWGVKLDDVKAMNHIKKAGSAAYDKLWNDYAIGLGYLSQKDYFNAITQFNIGVEKGYNKSILELARIYKNGKGVKVDKVKSFKLFKDCSNDSAYCMNEVGRAYEMGSGVKKDLSKAVEYYEKSASKNNGYGLEQLARFYQKGKGVQVDYVKSLSLFKQCSVNRVYCMNEVGRAYEMGSGVKKNLSKAREYYERSANKNNGYGLEQLGRLYEYGIGVTKDLVKAKSYYLKAKKTGRNMDKKLSRLTKKL